MEKFRTSLKFFLYGRWPALIFVAGIGVSFLSDASRSSLQVDGAITPRDGKGIISKNSGVLYVGRVRGPCEIRDSNSGRTIASNSTTFSKLVSGIFLSSEINSSQSLSIDCKKVEGFANGLITRPKVYSAITANVVMLFDVLVAILATPFLLILALFYESRSLNPKNDGEQKTIWLSAFIAIAIAYSLSLSRIPRLFMNGADATLLHILIRTLVTWFGLEFLYSRDSRVKLHQMLRFLFVLVMALNLLVYFSGDVANLVFAYKIQHPMYGIISAAGIFYLYNSGQERNRDITLIFLLWTSSQLVDSILNWLDSPVYGAESALFVFSLSFVGNSILNMKGNQWVREAVIRLLRLIELDRPIDTILGLFARELRKLTGFDRFSLYSIEESQTNAVALMRAAEFGYEKETDFDSVIRSEDGRGKKMFSALKSGQTVYEVGADDTFYCIIPLPGVGVVTLSNSKSWSKGRQKFVEKNLKSIDLVFRNLADRLFLRSFRKTPLLDHSLKNFGYGTHRVILVSMFIDITDFQKHTMSTSTGSPLTFPRFISEKYLPALADALQGVASAEQIEGDMIYFAAILSEKETVDDRASKMADILSDFHSNMGSRLALEFSLPNPKLTVGMAAGECDLIVDRLQARTSGTTPNIASRFQNACPANRILTERNLISSSKYCAKVKETKILIKKDLLECDVFSMKGVPIALDTPA